MFKVDLVRDHAGKPYCFIFVEDDKMKMYTLVEPMESIVKAFGKIPNFDIDDGILPNFLDRYEDLSPQHWETILDLENLHDSTCSSLMQQVMNPKHFGLIPNRLINTN